MKPTMRISVRNGEEITTAGTHIDAFGLAVVFESLSQAQTSPVYVYEGVEFWRANHAFIIAYRGESFMIGQTPGLEEFQSLLLEQKAS